MEAAVADKLPDWIADNQWNDWRWQMRNRIRTLADLSAKFPGLPVSQGMASAAEKFPLAITPYYAALVRSLDNSDPIFQQCVPQRQELYDPPCLKDDPLEEDEDMPVPGLVHRYSDRALLISTTTCSTYCRHCTRKRVAGHKESFISEIRLSQVVEYLSVHPEVKDVVISGGDPFTMPTQSLEKVLAAVRSVPSVDVIRLGTRAPVVLPMRITNELVQMLRKYHPIFVNTHFNHPAEVTPDAARACARLADAGIPLGNQTVLLRGVNDDPLVLEDLFRKLLRIRVRPYYLFQCDLVRGVEHFRTPLSRGIEIMEYLRGRMSGLGIPAFVVDAPHGGGKIPVLPNYVVSSSPSHTVLRNFEGMLVSYPEPGDLSLSMDRSGSRRSAPGVWDLAAGRQTKIQPHQTARYARRKARTQAFSALQLDMNLV
jgi:lysine 2,3-aminomutase